MDSASENSQELAELAEWERARRKMTYEERQQWWDKLPEKLQKLHLKLWDKRLRQERIDPLTGLPKGMTQEKFDEMNRATREKKLVKGREEAPPEPREGAPPKRARCNH